MHLTHVVLLAGALVGVMAHPSNHAHLHREVHNREVEVHTEYQTKTVWADPEPTVHALAQKPITSTSSAAAHTTLATSVSSSLAAEPTSKNSSPPPGTSSGFCGSSSAKNKRATLAQIMYTGNLGMNDGCPWNSNIITIPEGDLPNYDYTITVKNTASESWQCIGSNKMGFDGKLSGSFKLTDEPNQVPLFFTVPAGQTAFVAVDGNSQGQIICNPGTVPTSQWGQYMGIWLEFDMGNASNDGHSGADISSLVSQAGKQPDIPSAHVDTVSGSGTPSHICSGAASWKNAYIAGTEDVDGLGFTVIPGKVQLLFTLGYC